MEKSQGRMGLVQHGLGLARHLPRYVDWLLPVRLLAGRARWAIRSAKHGDALTAEGLPQVRRNSSPGGRDMTMTAMVGRETKYIAVKWRRRGKVERRERERGWRKKTQFVDGACVTCMQFLQRHQRAQHT